MAMKRCEHGHYYDPKKHSSCHACGVSGLDIEETRKKGVGNEINAGPNSAQEGQSTRRRGQQPIDFDQDEGATRRMPLEKLGMDPVVGWIVCVEGAARGRDYRIRSEKNFIGRSDEMQICIKGDDTISREKHAIISFNPKKQSFRFLPGESIGLIYLNNDEVDMPMDLKPYDIIEIGQTKLMFVPLCGEHFQWE
jgi:hypothetical protein